MRQVNHTAPSGAHFSLTFFTGVALGVALGMLFAPSEGRELRSQLTDRAQRLGRKTADTYNGAAETMGEWVERGRSATSAGREAFRRTRANGEAGAEA
jgi:gas vesicle protein